MDKTERDVLRSLVADFTRWTEHASGVRAWRSEIRAEAKRDERALGICAVDIARSGQTAWQVVPLEESDTATVGHLVARANLPRLTADTRDLLKLLTEDAPQAVAEVRPLLGMRRFFSGSAKKQAAADAVDFLRARHELVAVTDVAARLDELGTSTERIDPTRLTLGTLLDPALRLDLVSGRTGQEMLGRATFTGLPDALAAIAKVVANEVGYRSAAREAGEEVRRAEVRRVLREMPVDGLRTATRDRLRLTALTDARVTSVQEVLDRGMDLEALPGVGEVSARRMLGAAQALRQTTYDEMPVRIDIGDRRPETTKLLLRLAEWDSCRRTRGAAADLERAAELEPLRTAINGRTSKLLVIPTRAVPVSGLRESIEIVKRRAELLDSSSVPGRSKSAADPWEDFLARPADYFAMLSELGFVTEDEDAAHGDLPEEIIEAVRDQALSGEHLTASLRGYQSFAARFALVQRKVVIGDEMGLGKTVEAIAVLAHLRSRGETHFLVVCPAAVVTNWVREVSGKSTLRACRLHGPERDRAARTWVRDGGVAITTYETLEWAEGILREVRGPACVVVDEAHYIKNPQAKRTVRTHNLIARVDRAILLTGTPLENKVDEFRNLVSYLRKDLAVGAENLSPRAFRRQIAPAYLRRNQEDVLTELPELIEVGEWLPMSSTDARRYRAAVHSGNFMAMRQAAMLGGGHSEKVRRLVEIVGEAEENERRVIVFSYFRDVLDLVAGLLPGPVFGPLTGSVPATKRQQMVDRFSSARHGAVLVAQIMAGGVGLNIQSASVVVICEPQLKPTVEAQAIARAHRMGQVRSVQVHRLLSEDGVDQRIVELLAGKKQVFDEFARVSDMAGSTPEAVDLSEAELVREVVASERERLAERGASQN
jgi:superfamily II DNA or RNA helicase